MEPSGRSALLVGASGLVGSYLLQLLLEEPSYKRIRVLVRKPLDVDHEKLEQHVINFDQLEDHHEIIKADDVYCTLGTTMKKAKTKAQFLKVDYQYPLKVASLALENGGRQYSLVSSLGADANSLIFYSKTKGQVEQAISGLAYEAVHIFQPSLILGPRKEFRGGEKIGVGIMKASSWLLQGPFKKYRGIEASTIAKVMLLQALSAPQGVKVYPSDLIQSLFNQSN